MLLNTTKWEFLYKWRFCRGLKLIIELANKLRRSIHRRCLRDFHCFVLIILRPLLFSVWHFVRNLTLSSKTYHSKILKTHKRDIRHYSIALSSIGKLSASNKRFTRIILSCHYCHPKRAYNLLVYKEFVLDVKMTAN